MKVKLSDYKLPLDVVVMECHICGYKYVTDEYKIEIIKFPGGDECMKFSDICNKCGNKNYQRIK